MTIRAVFRVQCDGPCKGWLSWSDDYVPGTPVLARHEVVAPTAERAFNWPGEGTARRAAFGAGWSYAMADGLKKIMCPTCRVNPLGIVLPKPCPECGHVHMRMDYCNDDGCRCRDPKGKP